MSSDSPRPLPERPGPAWWASAVFYQIYPRSFADGNGDGVGDLIGARSRLGYLRELGVDALWLSPFYRSPMADGGYDVADPCDVDPMFGTLADFDALLAAAHELGLRVTIDIVPNHFSDQHPWFVEALAAKSGSPERDRFIFRPGRGPDGALPPNNWPSQFGGSAWSRVADGDWYLHIFAPEQPDLNWADPRVPAEFERILRFWLDRGVDGFRIDVAHGLAKPEGLPDVDLAEIAAHASGLPSSVDLRWDRDHVHDYLRGFRRVLNEYPGERMAVGEAWVANDARLANYVRPDELNLTFNFRLVEAEWGAESFRAAIAGSQQAMSEVGAACTWVLANHDVNRTVSRYGGGGLGLSRARAAGLMQLSLPGATYIYNGDELGLADVELPDDALQDPIWARSGHTERGRDGERVPLPWSGTRPPFGFGSGPSSWLPMPVQWAGSTAEDQVTDPGSTLRLYRSALALRASLGLGHGKLQWEGTEPWCLRYRRGPVVVLVNAGIDPVPAPAGTLLLSSGPLAAGQVPPDTSVWVRSD